MKEESNNDRDPDKNQIEALGSGGSTISEVKCSLKENFTNRTGQIENRIPGIKTKV
jgi:hypothetical protein